MGTQRKQHVVDCCTGTRTRGGLTLGFIDDSSSAALRDRWVPMHAALSVRAYEISQTQTDSHPSRQSECMHSNYTIHVVRIHDFERNRNAMILHNGQFGTWGVSRGPGAPGRTILRVRARTALQVGSLVLWRILLHKSACVICTKWNLCCMRSCSVWRQT